MRTWIYAIALKLRARASVGTRIANSFVVGIRQAGASLLSVLLFVEELGPSILVWIVLLGTPVFLIVRRYRKMRSRL